MSTRLEVHETASIDESLEFRVECYLAGELSREEAIAFEDALALP